MFIGVDARPSYIDIQTRGHIDLQTCSKNHLFSSGYPKADTSTENSKLTMLYDHYRYFFYPFCRWEKVKVVAYAMLEHN